LNKVNENKSLSALREVLSKHDKILGQDVVIQGRIKVLYENLLE